MHASAGNRKSVKLGKIDKDTLYIVMSENMKSYVSTQKLITMKDLIGEDILDPYGGNEDVYMYVALKIMDANEKLIDKIKMWRNV